MTAKDLATVIRGIAPVIREHLDGLSARIKALETRTPERGEKGEKGDPGERGETGPPGMDGASLRGDPGERGERGEPGAQGEKGDPGERGQEGPAGRDGRDGLPGVPGPTGEKGLDGKDGKDGINGTDGLGFDDIKVEHDGERGFTFKFVRGEQVKTFGEFTVPVRIYRGVYQSGKSYTYQDGTTWDGSEWVCMEPKAAGKPGTPGSGWLLTVKRGRDGKDGEKGLTGDRGPQGPPGKDWSFEK